MTPLRHAADLIRSKTHIAVCTHVAPDGDAIGAMLALSRVLSSMGKHPVLLCDDPVPEKLRFLPGSDAIRSIPPENDAPETLIALDASDAERLGMVAVPFLTRDIPLIVLDHHITNSNYGDINVVMPELASAAEIVILLLDELDGALDEDTALCLLTGIVTDTHGFSTANVTPDTLAAAQRLMRAGANLASVIEMALNRKSLETLRIWGLALTGIQWEGGLLWTALSSANREAIGASNDAHRGLSNLLMSAEGAHIVVAFVELDDGRVDVSMRAAPGYDVSGAALALGGGGHKLAAGCTLNGPLDEAVLHTLALLRNIVHT